jgi:hypothetical protein
MCVGEGVWGFDVGFGVGVGVVGIKLIKDGPIDGRREGSDDVGCIDGAADGLADGRLDNVMEGVDVLRFIILHQVVRTQVLAKYNIPKSFLFLTI